MRRNAIGTLRPKLRSDVRTGVSKSNGVHFRLVGEILRHVLRVTARELRVTPLMRLYHFVSEKYGIENIEKQRLKVSRIEDLNDPFELLGLELADGTLRKRLLNLKHQMSQDRGILCFSRAWTNPVQWSHYADLHRGVCLGFEVSPGLSIPVEYSARRLAPEAKQLLTGPITKETMRRVLCTKYSHWKYEQEERIFVSLEASNKDSKGLYFENFSSDLALVTIILGVRSSISRDQINRALRSMSGQVAIFKARLAFRSFRVVRNRDESLWT